MSQRIILSVEKPTGNLANVMDAWIGDFRDFRDLAENANVLWGDHIRVWADEEYMERSDDFIKACEDVRWPGVICSVQPLTPPLETT